jgi:3-hydroxyacyl-CoA dehydrogenase/enoyl-CoA hydratase/3-hydroxybutyryl-CoA epimerase
MISWDRRSVDANDGSIIVLTLDDPGSTVNTMGAGYLAAMASTVDRLEAERDSILGVVITSAKETFLAGADLRELTSGIVQSTSDTVGDRAYAVTETVKGHFRRLERLGRPVVAALNGTALAGGFELALACHRRIAVDDPRARFGLPEVTLGLLPGAGGVVRTTRMLGLQEALTGVLLQGQRLRPAAARQAGLVDELVATQAELLPRAIEWITDNQDSGWQPWDRPGYKMPGGTPSDRRLGMMLPAFPATLRKQLKGAHLPAAHAILCAAVEGAAVDVDTALRIESRWFASLVGTPIQRNMTQAFFFDLQHINKGGSRPASMPRSKPARVGVVGAGMMGGGIAHVCAKAGLAVVLLDVSVANAERAKELARGRRLSTEDLARITASEDIASLTDCDLVIEAVFEDQALKEETFRRIAAVVAPHALIASNTSSLPITTLAAAVDDPSNFVGLHFFSPVHRMPLVEIVRGKQTSDEALARGFDLVRLIGKTPIVVNDSRGFFTSRVFGRYVLEGLAMLGEGVPASTVEHAALGAGYPTGPLAVLDEVSLTLSRRLADEAAKAGVAGPAHPGEAVVSTMLDRYGRAGKAAGAGFYDYPADGSGKRLWPGLAEAFGAVVPPTISLVDATERLLFAEALEAVRCLDEGVVTSVEDANIGSILGIGFPAWTGGVLQYVDQYAGGVAGFVERARALAAAYGDRFEPSEPLVARAASGTPLRPVS